MGFGNRCPELLKCKRLIHPSLCYIYIFLAKPIEFLVYLPTMILFLLGWRTSQLVNSLDIRMPWTSGQETHRRSTCNKKKNRNNNNNKFNINININNDKNSIPAAFRSIIVKQKKDSCSGVSETGKWPFLAGDKFLA